MHTEPRVERDFVLDLEEGYVSPRFRPQGCPEGRGELEFMENQLNSNGESLVLIQRARSSGMPMRLRGNVAAPPSNNVWLRGSVSGLDELFLARGKCLWLRESVSGPEDVFLAQRTYGEGHS